MSIDPPDVSHDVPGAPFTGDGPAQSERQREWLWGQRAGLMQERNELRDQRDRLAAALREVSGLGGKTLLGPDSAHHMGEAAPRYHEMGAAAAFAQAAAIAEAALAEVPQ